MEKQRIIDLLNKLVDRSERYVKDAMDRRDLDDASYYAAQKKAFEEFKGIVESE